MTRDQRAGLCRLMLRFPCRRAELQAARTNILLELFESYELGWSAEGQEIIASAIDQNGFNLEYCSVIDDLEQDILQELNQIRFGVSLKN
jgi:hypothetical protein